MAFRSGFYNSVDHDRKYDAEDISAIFDGIIKDGVFATIGYALAVIRNPQPLGRLSVIVRPGKAWFDHTWNVNDADMPIELDNPDVTLKRYDAIVLEVDHSDQVRAASIKVVKGQPAASPNKPLMTKTATLSQYPLAFVAVRPGAETILAEDIEITVGTAPCPFVTGIIETVDIDFLFNQWDGEFNTWFQNVKDQLAGNVAANLQKQIDERLKISSKATSSEVSTGANNDKYVTPAAMKPTVTNLQNQINTNKNRFGKNKKLVATFTSSGTFYPGNYGLAGKTVDVFLLGGGGGGAQGRHKGSPNTGGRGGDGGECVYALSIPLTKTSYAFTVGAGGAGGYNTDYSGGGNRPGSNGGTTTIFGIKALGGSSGGNHEENGPHSPYIGGRGCTLPGEVGDTGSINTSIINVVYCMNDPNKPDETNIGGAGGGGGGWDSGSTSGGSHYGTGGPGINGGGRGGGQNGQKTSGASASGYGCGGGGGCAGESSNQSFGAGGGKGSGGFIRIYADI